MAVVVLSELNCERYVDVCSMMVPTATQPLTLVSPVIHIVVSSDTTVCLRKGSGVDWQ